MGRHKTDPQGTNRYIAAVGAIVIAVVLLVVGGLALSAVL